VSVMAVCDGSRHLLLPVSQDHNGSTTAGRTGGLAYIVPCRLSAGTRWGVERDVVRPALDGWPKGTPYSGVLYAGIMLTAAGPRVLGSTAASGTRGAGRASAADVRLGETLLAAASELSGDLKSGNRCPRPASCRPRRYPRLRHGPTSRSGHAAGERDASSAAGTREAAW
jgi:hypothetical protein